MEISEVKLAIIGIIFLEVVISIISYALNIPLESGLIYAGITAIAGLAGYDLGANRNG